MEPFYVTNNSSATPKQFQMKLLQLGIETGTDSIMTSAIAAAKYCKVHFDGASVMMIGEEGLQAALMAEGFKLTTESPDVVVVGIDRGITYEKLAEASLALRAGAEFIATNGDKAFPTEKGLVPGNGSFVKLLETTTDKVATYVGKPEPHLLHFIQQKGFRKEEIIMIGDNYGTDIQAGIRFGIDTAHVEGGVTSADVVKEQAQQPTYLFKNLSDWNRRYSL
ncbi:HAD-IIA family hydrolase [Sporosarcina thermotolerans]|uniref:HAD-IIA family hydrolase n=1 Tax=Sporosarcina thermotolerans TaxID=633404 RepID=UPI00321B24E9